MMQSQGHEQSPYNTHHDHFTSKLSLPKFIAVAQSLTHTQRALVKTMGFHHLLDLSCTNMPKSMVLWLVNHFDVFTRTFTFPNRYMFTISPHCIHQVLSIPVGGSSLPKICAQDTKKLISEEIKCNGKYPTINELKDMITSDLDGAKFKRIFTLFTVTSFLCPTSSDYASPEFFPVLENPDSIISFDWSTIVLDKLVASIAKFKQARNSCTTPSLGGCTFAMMVVYLELLQTSDINLPNSLQPRISLWSNDIVTTFLELDKMNDDANIFGRLPMRDINTTPFRICNITEGIFIDTSTDIEDILHSLLPGEAFTNARKQMLLSYEELWNDHIKALKPVLKAQIMKSAQTLRDVVEIPPLFFQEEAKKSVDEHSSGKLNKCVASRKKKIKFDASQHNQASDQAASATMNRTASTDNNQSRVQQPPHNSCTVTGTVKEEPSDSIDHLPSRILFSSPLHAESAQTSSQFRSPEQHFNDDNLWDDEAVKQMDEMVEFAKVSQQTPPQCMIPLRPSIFCHVFVSSPMERAIHQHIVNNIPAQNARSPRLIKMVKRNWVDHRTFGLSMQAYGSISPHVMNIMAVVVMESQFTKHLQGLLEPEEMGKFILHSDLVCPLQSPEFLPTEIAPSLSEKQIGFRLENADLVLVPVCKNRFWYLVVANFRDRRFEVICPFKGTDTIQTDAATVVSNFQKTFKAVHSRSTRVNIYDMPTVTASVSNYSNQNDSGVFVLQLLLSYDGKTHLHFKQDHAKPIRESLTYYLATHEENEIVMPELKQIAINHGIVLVNYTTGGDRSARRNI